MRIKDNIESAAGWGPSNTSVASILPDSATSIPALPLRTLPHNLRFDPSSASSIRLFDPSSAPSISLYASSYLFSRAPLSAFFPCHPAGRGGPADPRRTLSYLFPICKDLLLLLPLAVTRSIGGARRPPRPLRSARALFDEMPRRLQGASRASERWGAALGMVIWGPKEVQTKVNRGGRTVVRSCAVYSNVLSVVGYFAFT
ncbi:uncharacterized protein LOC109716226 [Ananas comosus]|uniref:Uncharacterized protein LOC109716226 n=1 Tax=Ananas comosus TaxID=4615 RepID=A0A6P5FLG2_ANACO|nr:uncharacterized protein LOC109716226 [Ananas comosus]